MKRGRQGQKYAEGDYNLTIAEWAKLKRTSDESVRKRIQAGRTLLDWEPRRYGEAREELERPRLYTPEETVKQYRSAAKKAGQILILADCNQMRVVDVVKELVENGVAVEELPQSYRKKFLGG